MQTDDSEQSETTELAALKLLLKQFNELREHLSHYVTARSDGIKLALRNTLLWIALSALGLVAVSGLIITASWFMLSGTAEGLGVLCGGRLWVGKIIAGCLVLAGFGLAMYYCTRIKQKITSADQSAEAKTAMNQTLHDMKETVNGMVDVRSCMKQHPWLITASAAAVGFVTGAALTPNSKAEVQPSDQEQETPRTKKSFLFSTLGTVLAGILKMAMETLITSAVMAKDRVETPSPGDPLGPVASEGATTKQHVGL